MTTLRTLISIAGIVVMLPVYLVIVAVEELRYKWKNS